jgi:acyl carrier protein
MSVETVPEHEDPDLPDIVAAVIGVDSGELTDQDGPATVGAWTSRKQIELLVTLEEYYGVNLTSAEILSAATIGALRAVLRAKGVR